MGKASIGIIGFGNYSKKTGLKSSFRYSGRIVMYNDNIAEYEKQQRLWVPVNFWDEIENGYGYSTSDIYCKKNGSSTIFRTPLRPHGDGGHISVGYDATDGYLEVG